MTKNTLGDLNGYLFERMAKLSEEDLKGEDLKEEIEKTKAISCIAKDIVSNANLVLQAQRFTDEKWDADKKPPKMLEG